MNLRLRRYGESGWEFEVTKTDPVDGTISERYRTNPMGDGLWKYQESRSIFHDGTPVMEYRQVRGTTQFWLPPERRRAYDKLRRIFSQFII